MIFNGVDLNKPFEFYVSCEWREARFLGLLLTNTINRKIAIAYKDTNTTHEHVTSLFETGSEDRLRNVEEELFINVYKGSSGIVFSPIPYTSEKNAKIHSKDNPDYIKTIKIKV